MKHDIKPQKDWEIYWLSSPIHWKVGDDLRFTRFAAEVGCRRTNRRVWPCDIHGRKLSSRPIAEGGGLMALGYAYTDDQAVFDEARREWMLNPS
jgi:hypothetical protein